MKKLFVGKLSYSTTEEGLRAAFEEYAPLGSVKVITDQMTGKSRGFGFVEIEDGDKADTAVQALNGTQLDGREIVVSEARPQGEFRSGGGGDRGGDRGGNRSSGGSRGGNRGGGERGYAGRGNSSGYRGY